jgi:hypothetical protein
MASDADAGESVGLRGRLGRPPLTSLTPLLIAHTLGSHLTVRRAMCAHDPGDKSGLVSSRSDASQPRSSNDAYVVVCSHSGERTSVMNKAAPVPLDGLSMSRVAMGERSRSTARHTVGGRVESSPVDFNTTRTHNSAGTRTRSARSPPVFCIYLYAASRNVVAEP